MDHKIRNCFPVARNKVDNHRRDQTYHSSGPSGGWKQDRFYALQTRQDHEGFPDVAIRNSFADPVGGLPILLFNHRVVFVQGLACWNFWRAEEPLVRSLLGQSTRRSRGGEGRHAKRVGELAPSSPFGLASWPNGAATRRAQEPMGGSPNPLVDQTAPSPKSPSRKKASLTYLASLGPFLHPRLLPCSIKVLK
uniref:Uncharacterized protein n=1 Tax=Solanum tuberosum TaxID=4113 RepID=M1DXZ9_SOLTU